MKYLYIARHAKAEQTFWKKDIERLITDIGEKRTLQIVNYLKINSSLPEYIVSSHAIRALSTASIYAEQLGIPKEKIVVDNCLFSGDIESIIEIIKQFDNNIESAMILGHNPNFTYLANHFIANVVDNLPTSGIVVLAFDCDSWKDISNKNVELKFKIWPGML